MDGNTGRTSWYQNTHLTACGATIPAIETRRIQLFEKYSRSMNLLLHSLTTNMWQTSKQVIFITQKSLQLRELVVSGTTSRFQDRILLSVTVLLIITVWPYTL